MAFARRIALPVLIAAAALSACATAPSQEEQFSKAGRIDAVWQAENVLVTRDLAERRWTVTPAQLRMAAANAMTSSGFVVDESASSPSTVTGRAQFSRGGWSWNLEAQSAEWPRIRGIVGNESFILPRDEQVTARAVIGFTDATGTRITLSFGVEKAESMDCERAVCPSQIPPAALRAGYDRFWAVLDDELDAVVAADAQAGRRPRTEGRSQQPRRARPPSTPRRWTPPPSGWRPPTN